VMTIYTGYILLGKSYQYDMNVVHYIEGITCMSLVYIYKMYSIDTYKEKIIVGSKIKISYFYLDLRRRER
jgi:hypothetical protein